MGNSELKLAEPWRAVDWSKRDKLVETLKNIKPKHPDTAFMRILLYGPVGVGKSSFITSIDSVFKKRASAAALAGNDEHSYSTNYKTFRLRTQDDRLIPVAFNDIMGMTGGKSGIQTGDVINAVNGHLPENYLFDVKSPLKEGMEGYNHSPTLQDRPHCVVCVVSADSIQRMDSEDLDQMKRVRRTADKLGIPHIGLLTMPDKACPLVFKDLKDIYKSKAIKMKMEQCSSELGLALNNILPVQNYHKEIEVNDLVDVLLLIALNQMVNFANDYLWRLQHQL